MLTSSSNDITVPVIRQRFSWAYNLWAHRNPIWALPTKTNQYKWHFYGPQLLRWEEGMTWSRVNTKQSAWAQETISSFYTSTWKNGFTVRLPEYFGTTVLTRCSTSNVHLQYLMSNCVSIVSYCAQNWIETFVRSNTVQFILAQSSDWDRLNLGIPMVCPNRRPSQQHSSGPV